MRLLGMKESCSSFIGELPNILLLDGHPYAIAEGNQTVMVLPIFRDQTPLSIDDEGLLVAYGVTCMKTTDIPAFTEGETINVDGVTTVWRKTEGTGSYFYLIPKGGRIIILDTEFNIEHDTLYRGKKELEVNLSGAYVAFMANKQAQFKAKVLDK